MGIHQVIDRDALASMAADAEKTAETLASWRRHEDVEAIVALIAHARISAAMADAAQAEAVRWRLRGYDDNLSTLAIDEARRFLDANGVPQAAFFDDHVANAVVQRNLMGRLVHEVLARLNASPDNAAFAEGIRHRCEELGYAAEDEDRVGNGRADAEAGPGAA